uniref:Putative serine/threonine protein n=1 Tax=Amblyomma triste TaxID=251400 RepID=A0A023G5U5_AMBTT
MKGAAFSAVQLPITLFLLIYSWYPHQANGQHCRSPVCYFVNGDADCGSGCLCYSNPDTPNDEEKGVCAGDYGQQPAQQPYGTTQGTGYGHLGGGGPSYGTMGQGYMGEGVLNSLGNGLGGMGRNSPAQTASLGPSSLQNHPGTTPDITTKPGSGPVSTAKTPDAGPKPGSPQGQPSKPSATPSKPESPSPAPVKATSHPPTSAKPPSGINKPPPPPASKPRPLPQLRSRLQSRPRTVSLPRPRLRRG